ncbi:tyrosine-type recombinase/integrase [Sphingomonas albertensis]|uniref:tyrosine-type recombinase/integrase n=1 Tax=Sphingomonas albertensis TaxID=2762591 RepID=UPI0037DA39F9
MPEVAKRRGAYGCRQSLRWHDLRHSWTNWLGQDDVPPWGLQALGGGKSEAMVRRYAHMSVKHLQPYADLLIFGGKSGHAAPEREGPGRGHKTGHSTSPFGPRRVGGTELNALYAKERMVDALGLEPRTR